MTLRLSLGAGLAGILAAALVLIAFSSGEASGTPIGVLRTVEPNT